MKAAVVIAPTEITERVYNVAMDYLAANSESSARMREMDRRLLAGGSLTSDELRQLYVDACWTKLANGN
jgi:hypothetical protein